MYPSTVANFHYRDIINVFKRSESWSQMIFYCKAYYKSSYEKKNPIGGNAGFGLNNSAMGGGMGMGYNDTISKPSFLLKEKEKEVFLNGEVTHLKDVPGFGGNGRRTVKKTTVCLKCLQVDDNLR